MGYNNFKRYCRNYRDIENYEKALKDNFKGWNCHHRLETHNSDGERRLVDITTKELKALGMYYGRPADELIFLKISEHSRLHMKGKHLSEETRKKIGAASKNRSEETRRKLREAKKGKQGYWKGKCFSEEIKERMSKARKGRHWYNNGKENKFCYECPDGFIPGMLK